MVTFAKSLIAVLAAFSLIVGISGCKKQGTPAEDAGKEIDKTVDKAGQKVEETGQKIKDAAKNPKK